MKEARIECLIRVPGGFPVHDLGLKLHLGQVEHVDAGKARKSKDLTHARRIGAVEVQTEERCRMAKKLPEPKRHLPPSVGRSRPSHKPPTAASPRPQKVDMEEVARRAETAAAEASERAVTKALEKLSAAPAAVSQDMLEAALRNVLAETGGIPAATPTETPAAEPDPVFIPTGIVPDDAKADISVQTETTEAAGLDEAAAALKAAKPKRRSRAKKPKE